MTHTHTTAESLNALPDAAFNRVVAELAGWRIERRTSKFQDYEIYHKWVFVRPDGSEFNPRVAEKWLQSEFLDCIPDYADDLNAAWGLCFTPERVDISWWSTESGKAWVEVTTAISKIRTEHPQPARALATAWVLWRQAQTTDEREG